MSSPYCPECGGKMVREITTWECIECGYYFTETFEESEEREEYDD